MASEETMLKLKALARERHVSLGVVVREALEAKASEFRPPLTCIGIGNSGSSNISSTEATERVPPLSWQS